MLKLFGVNIVADRRNIVTLPLESLEEDKWTIVCAPPSILTTLKVINYFLGSTSCLSYCLAQSTKR